jgi:hypothetical protein
MAGKRRHAMARRGRVPGRPTTDYYSRWDFRTDTEFPIVKLLDYATHDQALEADPNPFAMVVLAHLKTLETRRSPTDRHTWKLRLVKGLYERGMDADDVRQLLEFIDWIMDLPPELEQLFRQEITVYQQGKRMPFIDVFDRFAIEQYLLKGLEVSLKLKFGDEGLKLMPELREIQDHELLGKILRAVETAVNPDDLRRVWTRKRRSKRKGQA